MTTQTSGYTLDLSTGTLGILFLTAVGIYLMARGIKRAIRNRSWKKGLVMGGIGFTLLAAAIILAIAGGKSALLGSSFFLIFCAICVIVFTLWQFLRKVIGSLLFLSLAGLIVAVILFIRSLVAFTGDTKIATITVLDMDSDTMTLHIEKHTPSGPEAPTMLKLKGDRFGTVIYQVIFDSTAVFLGSKTRYAWLGMTAFSAGAKQSDLHLFPDSMNKMSVFSAMERREIRLPFIRSVQLSMDSKIAQKGKVYTVLIKNNGGILITPAGK